MNVIREFFRQSWNMRKNCFWIITENLYKVMSFQDMWVELKL